MKKKAIVLGCGLVGATMARDLAEDSAFEATAADVSELNLMRVRDVPNLQTVRVDLGTPEHVRNLIGPYDLVVGSMPSALGFMVLRTVIESGKPYADISFMPQDATELDELAKRHGVTAVVDCGVAPGLANLIIGHCTSLLDRTQRVAIYVGGLPKHPQWPYHYKAPFAPSDVIEEYTRPARMIENGRVVTKPALSDPEIIELPRAGRLEAFNTDGLRSLLKTVKADDMTEKTLRYPGHAELMRVFRETGFFRKDEIPLRTGSVRPIELTSKLLFPMWEAMSGEEEFTVLRVVVEGEKGGRRLRHVYDLYDESDLVKQQTSMARTTGFPCVIVARMILEGVIREKGVLPPERLAREPGVMQRVTDELARRGVNLASTTMAL